MGTVHHPAFGDQNEPENRLENVLQIRFKNQPLIGFLFSANKVAGNSKIELSIVRGDCCARIGALKALPNRRRMRVTGRGSRGELPVQNARSTAAQSCT